MKKIQLAGIIFLLLFTFMSCEKDEDLNNGNNNPPEADAGQDVTAATGSTVGLNGDNSTDPDGDELIYLWELTAKPSNSNATITNATEALASFMPDVEGFYTVQLTVNDGTLTDTDEVLVTVDGGGAAAETVMVGSNIDTETVWEDIFEDPSVPDYIVERDIKVNAKLSVEPGVVVHLKEDAILTVESGGGTIIAEGEENNKIVFTSTDEAGEIRWGGLHIRSSSAQNVLEHVNFNFAGGVDNLVYVGQWRAATIGLAENGKLRIGNTSVRNSGGDGIFVHRTAELTGFENNSFSSNAGYPISLSINHLGKISNTNTFSETAGGEEVVPVIEKIVRVYDSVLEEDQEWTQLASGAKVLFQGDVSIEANLSLAEGVVLEFDEGVKMEVEESGTIKAIGTEANPVVFTSSGVADGRRWAGLYIFSSSVNNALDHTIVSYAGGGDEFYFESWLATTIGLGEDARLKFTNSEVSYSNGHGIVVHRTAAFEDFAGNSFHHNKNYPILLSANGAGMIDNSTLIEDNDHNVVAIYNSTFDDNALFRNSSVRKWVALGGDARYLVTGKLEVDGDLDLEVGVHLTFLDEVLVEVNATGSLKAVGSTANKIILTAYQADGNHNWGGIYFDSSSQNNRIENTEVSYAGNNDMYVAGWDQANIGISDTGYLFIENATVSNSKGYGILMHSEGTMEGGANISYSNIAKEELEVR